MANHRSIDLQLRVDKPENVYRFIYDWRVIPSSHDSGVSYLLIHALVQWGSERDYPVNAFSIAVQYSPAPGRSVDVSQPPHILEEDVEQVAAAFQEFMVARKGQR